MQKQFACFVPLPLIASLSFPEDGSITKGEELVLKTTDDFYTRGVILEGSDEALEDFLASSGLTECGTNLDHIIFSRRSVFPQITQEELEGGDEKELLPTSYPALMQDATKSLAIFCRQTGFKANLPFWRKK